MIIVFIGGTNKFTRPGGIPSYFYELQNYLQVSLDNAYFLEIGEEERLEHQHILYGTLSQNFFVRAWKMRQVLRKLKKRHKKLVFSIHYWRELIFSLDMILQGDVIMHFHGPAWMEAKIEKKSPIYVFLAKQYEHLFYQKSKLIICLSEHYKNLLIDEYKIEPQKVVKIPFGFKIAQKSFYAQPSKSQVFHIICVRRLANRMGLDLLIEACDKLSSDNYSFRLDIIGSGLLYEQLNAQIQQLELADKVFLQGFVTDEAMEAFYKKANLAVMPSRALEGFGISTVESLYRGIPTIGTNIGGTPEILRPLSPDLIIEEVSATAIYQKLKSILSGTMKLPSRNACHKYVVKHYNIEKIGHQIHMLYEAHLTEN